MNAATESHPQSPPRPLGLLGRDEMNLAEFPITLLTDRVPKDQKEAVYRDEIYDERSGLTLTRQLTISAGSHGLTTAVDDEVILALIQITKLKNDFQSRKVTFTRLEWIRMLGWTDAGANYDRVKTSLDRWTSVYLKYENAWRDNREKSWTSKGFHIIETFELNDGRMSGDQADPMPSYIVWNEVIFESFQAGYLKPLDYDLCLSLTNSTAKRMYRFLDKRFHHKPDWTFDLKEFAHEHIGLGRNYDGPAHLKRKLLPAIAELETVAFLEPLPHGERFSRDGTGWKIRLISRSRAPSPPPSGPKDRPEGSGLVTELVQRGVTRATAAGLVQRHAPERIGHHTEVFDWLVEKQDRRVSRSPAGYLVASIEKDYAAPQGFVPKAEREEREDARRRAEREAAEDRRRRQEQEARDRAERQAIAAYWAALTPQQQAELDAASRAAADPDVLAMEARDDPTLKRLGQQVRRQDYIRQLLGK